MELELLFSLVFLLLVRISDVSSEHHLDVHPRTDTGNLVIMAAPVIDTGNLIIMAAPVIPVWIDKTTQRRDLLWPPHRNSTGNAEQIGR